MFTFLYEVHEELHIDDEIASIGLVNYSPYLYCGNVEAPSEIDWYQLLRSELVNPKLTCAFVSACNCNGFSNRCIFDEKLYNQTGHGGYCLECTANRDGPNCERCRENYYQQEDGFCRPCECNEVGSRSLQCDRKGQCQCKQGVTGEKCDRCAENFYDFDVHGCKSCGCSREGSYNNEPRCDPQTGVCQCKENIEGKRCRQCKPG